MSYITPERFGAKGDGVTDDTAAVQSAINAVCGVPTAAHRARLVWLMRHYSVGPLVIPSNTTLVGHGIGKLTLRAASNDNLLSNADQDNGNTNITVDGLILDGNASAQSRVNPCHGVALYYTTASTVRNCQFVNFEKDGVYVAGLRDKPCRDVLIVNNRFDAIRRNGVAVVHGHGVTITGNQFGACNTGGDGYIAGAVDIEPNVNQAASQIVIAHNTFDPGGHAPAIQVYTYDDCVRYIRGVTITGNAIVTDHDGVHVRGSSVSDITIANNTMRLNGERFGVLLADGAFDVAVTGNTISNPGTGVFACSDLHDVTIAGNVVRRATGYGIQSNRLNQATVASNVISVTSGATAITYLALNGDHVVATDNATIQEAE